MEIYQFKNGISFLREADFDHFRVINFDGGHMQRTLICANMSSMDEIMTT